MERSVETTRTKQRHAVAVGRNERQQHRDKDQNRRCGNTDERVGRANGTAAHLTRFGHNGRLELVERRVRGSTELLGGSTELLARRLARRSVTRLTVLLLAGLAEGSLLGLLALLRLATKLLLALLAGLAEGGLLALLRLRTELLLTGLAGLAEGSLLALLRLHAELGLTLLPLLGSRAVPGLTLLRLGTELRLTLLPLLGSRAVLGLTGLLTEGSLLTLLRLRAHLGLTLRLSVCLRRVAEGRLRDLLLRRQGGSGLAVRGGFRLRCALEDCLLEVVIVRLGGLAHGSLGLDVGSLGFCGSLNVRLFDRGLLNGGLSRGGVSLGLRFLVDTGERLDLLAGFLRGSLGLGGHRFLDSRGLRGNDTLVRQPLPKGRVQRRVRCDVGTQVRASGSDIREILGRKRRIAQVGSGELRRIDSAHLYSSRTRRCSS